MKLELYSALRGEMKKRGMDQTYLANKLSRSLTYVSVRFTGKKPWTQKDQYAIMDLFQLPYDRLHEIFPKDGVYVDAKPRSASHEEIELARAIRILTGTNSR